jgi:hypothetical protein
MRRLLIACALVLTAYATQQAHADPIPADPELVRACVAQAAQDRAALQQCPGIVTRACIEAQGGSNSMSDVLCRGAEAGIWEALIAESTARITAADPVDGALLNASSQLWTSGAKPSAITARTNTAAAQANNTTASSATSISRPPARSI